jgi:hypothetical protein
MRRFLVAAAAVVILVLPTQAFSQGASSISGTITDATGAVLPGVVVTATNTGTNVVTTATANAAGVYSFASLQPGTYKMSAEMAGFQTLTFSDIQLGTGRQIRLNFELQVRKLEQSVEVSVASDMLLLESSSSVANVLPENQVASLPLVNNNSLDLVKIMGGVVMGNNALWDAEATAFAGVSGANINVQRDGVTINDVRYPTGINSPTRLNPDMVGEFRMVLSPVDAEMGRGSGQVQVLTKSGSNNYHGSVVWNLRNSALDANTWYNNTYGVTAPYSNQHQYTLSFGGPIIKDKTFFYALWDQQIVYQRVAIDPPVLTPCAQRGIFRYFDNWNNGNVQQITTTGGTPTTAVINLDGSPKPPTTNPDGTPHNGILRYYSVFHPLLNTPTAADCSDAVFDTGAPTWDGFRTQRDPTNWIDGTFLAMMPLPPNNYEVGDGLNVAGHRWNRSLKGGMNLWGIVEDTQRKQINVKLDHNFSSAHRISGSWSYDRMWADDSYTNWPNGYNGINKLNPQVLTVNLTSTLKPTLLNEFRFGMSRTGTNVYSPLDRPGNEELRSLFPEYNGLPVLIGPGSGGANFAIQQFGGPGLSHFYGTSGLLPIGFRDTSPRWTYGDTITWTKGRHSFKGGFEFRKASSKSITKGNWFAGTTYPYASGGSAGGATMMFNQQPPGMAGSSFSGNRMNMEGLLNFLAGSIGTIQQYYFVNSPTDTAWNDPTKVSEKIRDFRQNEFDFFFKDDWKVTDDLTLNLGVRYEYYGVPYLGDGLTVGWTGGDYAPLGPGGSFDNWFIPGAGDPNFRTGIQFIGPDSPNPSLKAFNRDLNNFGPAIGFAWQLPWFGKGKTTLRGGYQLNYLTMGRSSSFDFLGEAPGMTYTTNWAGQDWGTGYYPYLDLTTLPVGSPVPIDPTAQPLKPVDITDRSASMTAFDPNIVAPYIQNLTLSITRNLGSNMTLDVRYIGTLTRKSTGSLNVNLPNFMTNGLLEAFNSARAGGESALLDQMFEGLTAPGVSGAEHLRTAYMIAPQIFAYTPPSTLLARGDYQGLANLLNATSANCGYNGCLMDKMGAQNFIKANPQFNNSTLYSNYGSSNYHGLQAQFTLRPTHGVSFQGTYTWSRNLGYGVGTTDPRNARADYALLASHRSHTFTTYGSIDLPFGQNRAFFNSSPTVVNYIIGDWQVSWTGNLSTGRPTSIVGYNMLYGSGTPDLVGTFDNNSPGVYWESGSLAGNTFGDKYIKVRDPQCSDTSIVDPSLADTCRQYLAAIALASDPSSIVFQNPLPGKRGNVGLNTLKTPNEWNFDMSASKGFRVTEGIRLSVRVDVLNVFNHAQEAGSLSMGGGRTTEQVQAGNPPNYDINNANPFGYLSAKVGRRMFQAKVRLDF